MSKIKTVLILIILLLFCDTVRADVELGGYTFSDDNTELHMNTYFSEYDRMVDFLTSLYVYGDFTYYNLSQTFHQTFILDGIDCVVIREDLDIPQYDGSSPLADVHNIYYYYAKDIEDNIHILQFAYYTDENSSGWQYTNLPEGKTKLKYPADPVPDQEVFFGHVSETSKQVGEISGCVTIANKDLPWASEPSTEYLRPSYGVFAISYNWNGGINGYSSDGSAPEYAEEEGAWEEWLDDHCFISACSP